MKCESTTEKGPMHLPESFIDYWCQCLNTHEFYRKKFSLPPNPVSRDWFVANFQGLPFTTKEDLIADQQQHPPYGNFHHLPRHHYTRVHQTSGSTGNPVYIQDTQRGWEQMLHFWDMIFQAIGIRAPSRLFFAFSFGPFLGFWTAFEAATRAGNYCVPGGAMSTEARVESIIRHEIEGVFCTPSYAIRLGETALAMGKSFSGSHIRWLVLAGEPGAQIPATREKIENLWGKIIVDHHGMTETGPVSYECPNNPGILHIPGEAFTGEVVNPRDNSPCGERQMGELILSNWGREGASILRYKTGDLVTPTWKDCNCGFHGLSLPGGIQGRVDDMIFYKGNNIFPSAIQNLVHQFPEITDFQVRYGSNPENPAFELTIEVSQEKAALIKESLEILIQKNLLFKPEVIVVKPNTFQRGQMKVRRFLKS